MLIGIKLCDGQKLNWSWYWILEASKSFNSQELLEPNEREMNKLKANKMFYWIKHHDQESVSSEWVITEKQMDDGS